MPEPAAKNIGDIIAVVKRRTWSLVLPAVLVFAVSAAVAFSLDPLYQSTCTILIEDQDIPRDFVMSTVTSFAEHRLQSINQRIMSTTRLLEIINRFNLYADQRKKRTMEEIVARMREKDIKFQSISGNVVDRRTGGASMATIAFTLSFRGERPAVVQEVASVLASLYLEENLRIRKEQVVSTSRFLEDELKEIKGQLGKIENRITPFKTQHMNSLPEHLPINLQSLERVERDMERVRSEMRSAREREKFLQTQMELLKEQKEQFEALSNQATTPSSPRPDPAEEADKALLAQMKARLIQLKSKFTDQYPDVVKTKIEIEELEKKVASYAAEKDSDGEKPPEKEAKKIDKSAIVTLGSQIAATQREIESLKKDLEELALKKGVYQQRIEATPAVEENFREIVLERQNLQAKYDDLMKKVLEARVSQGLEKEQKGERFTIIDPARFPEKPVSPNIPAILLIGLVLGIGAGVGTAGIREFADQSVRTADELAAAAQFPVLGGIPVILTKKERRRRRLKRWAALGSTLLVLTAAPLIFHFFIMDLDILWAKLIRIYNRMM
jgi:polysaccharide chain length determinant protein (PEP-CTERM system associated)